MLNLIAALLRPIGYAAGLYITMNIIGRIISFFFMLVILTIIAFKLCC